MSEERNMMRIRYMELPTEIDGDQTRTPFIIIIDRAGDMKADEASRLQQIIQGQTDARGVVVVPWEVQIGDDY